jgi:carboxypeptidase Taq
VPAAWNEKMRELLGIVPPTDREGCLQDIHWSSPTFGYFPTYALGNLYAAQFYQAALEQESGLEEALARGETEDLVAWLREYIHRHGRKFLPSELVEQVTGRPLDHHAFVGYVTGKFSQLYGL